MNKQSLESQLGFLKQASPYLEYIAEMEKQAGFKALLGKILGRGAGKAAKGVTKAVSKGIQEAPIKRGPLGEILDAGTAQALNRGKYVDNLADGVRRSHIPNPRVPDAVKAQQAPMQLPAIRAGASPREAAKAVADQGRLQLGMKPTPSAITQGGGINVGAQPSGLQYQQAATSGIPSTINFSPPTITSNIGKASVGAADNVVATGNNALPQNILANNVGKAKQLGDKKLLANSQQAGDQLRLGNRTGVQPDRAQAFNNATSTEGNAFTQAARNKAQPPKMLGNRQEEQKLLGNVGKASEKGKAQRNVMSDANNATSTTGSKGEFGNTQAASFDMNAPKAMPPATIPQAAPGQLALPGGDPTTWQKFTEWMGKNPGKTMAGAGGGLAGTNALTGYVGNQMGQTTGFSEGVNQAGAAYEDVLAKIKNNNSGVFDRLLNVINPDAMFNVDK